MAHGITDLSFAEQAAGEAEGVSTVTTYDVQLAAQEVVDAAVRARSKEIVEEDASIDEETGEVMRRYFDPWTGHIYLPLRGKQWQNAATNEVVDDPSHIDRGEYQWVLDMFAYFHTRRTDFAYYMAQDCQQAKLAIQSSRMASVETVQGIVADDWGGYARDDFNEYFLAPFTNAVTNQQQVLDELAVGMYVYYAMLKQAAVDARAAAEVTVRVLDGLADSRTPDGTFWLQVGLAVAGVVLAVSSGGTGAPIGVGLIAAALEGGGAGLVLFEQQKQRTASGVFVGEVLENLRRHLDEQRRDMEAVERGLADHTNALTDRLEELLAMDHPLDVGTILPSEPNDDVTNVTDVNPEDEASFLEPGEFRPEH